MVFRTAIFSSRYLVQVIEVVFFQVSISKAMYLEINNYNVLKAHLNYRPKPKVLLTIFVKLFFSHRLGT